MSAGLDISVNGRRLFAPGERVRFVAAPAIEAMVDSTLIHGAEFGVNVYRLIWYDDGKRHEESAGEREVEAIPDSNDPLGFKAVQP